MVNLPVHGQYLAAKDIEYVALRVYTHLVVEDQPGTSASPRVLAQLAPHSLSNIKHVQVALEVRQSGKLHGSLAQSSKHKTPRNYVFL